MLQIDFSIFPVLQTERLLLRRLQAADEKEIFALRSNDSVNKYLDRPKANSPGEALQFIQKICNGIDENTWIFWAVTMKPSGVLIGTISLWNIDRVNAVAEIGYELLPDYQGKGIMQEAFSKVAAFGFDQMGLNMITAFVHIDNQRSVRLLERNYFKRNTELERVYAAKESVNNCVIYALTKNTS